MAQTVFVNITLDAQASKKPDRSAHSHASARGAAASGDVTVSFDPLTVKTHTVLRSAVDAALLQMRSGKELTD